jgi:hypothetical protein
VGLVQDESSGIADGRNINRPGGQLDEGSEARQWELHGPVHVSWGGER